MADRTVSVKLIADASAYIRGVEEASRKTRESSDQIEQRLAQQREAYQQVGALALGFGALVVAGVGAAVSAYADFDAAMSNVQAATGESAAGMQALSDAALEAGAETAYSATEAAGAIEELSKAGVATADILGGALDGALSLAAAGQIDVAEAAETAASAMTQFGLEGSDVTHIADLLAAAAGNAQGGVSDMGQALNQAGLVASQMGLSIEETTGTLASFASAGLIGSDAGTSFRAMLLRLANPTGEVSRQMEELGISVYDAQGNFIGMEGVAGQLQDRMSGLDQETRNAALATIFGQDAIRAASILYTEGAEGVAEWTRTVDDAGYAAEQAAARQNNLRGDLEALGGAFETLMIVLGAGADGPLRGFVSGLDDVVSGLAEMPDWAAQATITVAALTGGIALAGGAALIAIPQFAALKTSFDTMGLSGDRASRAMAGLKGALGIGAVAFAALGAATALNDYLAGEFLSSTAEVQNTLTQTADAAELLQAAMGTRYVNPSIEAARAELDNVSAALDDAIGQARNWWDAIAPQNTETLGNIQALGDAIGTLADTDLSQAQAQFAEFATATDGSREQLYAALSTMDDYREHLIEVANQQGINVTTGSDWENQEALIALALGETAIAADGVTDSSGVMSEELVAQEEAATAALESITELADALRGLNDTYYSAQDANAGYYDSIDQVTTALSEGLLTATLDASGAIDQTSEAGRTAESLLSGMASSALDSAAAMIELDGNTANASARINEARQRFIDAAVAAGINASEAARLADAYGLTEGAVEDLSAQILAVPDGQASITVSTDEAENVLQRFINQRRVAVIEVQAGPAPSIIARPGVATAFAAGGRIPGYAPGYDDRLGFDRNGNVFGLGGGEYIMPTLATDKYLPILEAMRNGTLQGYAGGGRISTPNYASSYSPSINVSSPTVVMPQTMQATIDMGGQLVDAVVRITDNRISANNAQLEQSFRQG